MDEFDTSADLTSSSKHQRVIIHIDVDCFYAQVEMVKNPSLREQPLGIQQKNIVVTSNYVARKFGIKKCILVTEALKLCPNLVLVSGEDLHDYRQMSVKITSLLQKFSPLVEKLGLDENFVDVTQIVNERLESSDEFEDRSIQGHRYSENLAHCSCGCFPKLCIGSGIASEMRKKIEEELNMTTCAGISYNKLLAKLVGSTHKPNQQTTLLPSGVSTLISSLASVRSLPGIGHSMSRLLQTHNISTIPELQNTPLGVLQRFLSQETALRFKKICFGLDDSPVKCSGRPSSLGLEDSVRKISLESEVRDKFNVLLQRLVKLLAEDGRVPRCVKVTVRKYDGNTKQSLRESRQCNVTSFFPHSFTQTGSTIPVILGFVMKLFHKIVDISKPFHITLLGVSFSKFVDRASGKSSISSFLQKDVSVQTITNIKGETSHETVSSDRPPSVFGFRTPSSRLCAGNSGSESDVEPSPKKMRRELWSNKRKRLWEETDRDVPGKLPVSECSRGSVELDRDISELRLSSPVHPAVLRCPGNVDRTVFSELPPEVQQELVEEWESDNKSAARLAAANATSRLVGNVGKNRTTLHNYFSPQK